MAPAALICLTSQASFSALNWQAAALAGLPPQGDALFSKNPPIYTLGVDGKPKLQVTSPVQLTFAGNVASKGDGKGKSMTFEPPPAGWKAWEPVVAAVGDLPVFAQLLGDGTTPFAGPAALIGLDVLSQRRVVLSAPRSAAELGSRMRRLYVSPR